MELKKEVKEVQGTIIPIQNNRERVSEEEFFNVLKTVAPGTNLRLSLDGALKTGKGALIVVENDNLQSILDGGFKVNCRFTPQRLIELTKMDGAIILSSDLKRITAANVMLAPDNKIRSNETGTRHKAAERTSKQTNCLVVAISERKHEITIFYKNLKHILKSTEELLRKANEQIQLLEKHREIFDKHIEKLNKLELRNYLNLNHAISVIQKGRLIQKIAKDLKKFIIELGNEGTLLKTRLKEITHGVEKETDLVIKDYTKLDLKKSKFLLESLSYEEILEQENILKILAYESSKQIENLKGWRILSKTSLQEQEMAQIIKDLGSLGKIIHSNANTYSPIIGSEKAQTFKEEIEKIKLGQL